MLLSSQLHAQPDTTRELQVCVVQNGTLTQVTAMYDTRTGDTTFIHQGTAVGYPSAAEYASGVSWYINNEVIAVNGRRYVKYGLPRVLGLNEITRTGVFQDVAVFAEAGASGVAEVVYVPVRPGCEFQPYQLQVKVGGVRDSTAGFDEIIPDRNAFPSAAVPHAVRGSTSDVLNFVLQELAARNWRSRSEVEGTSQTIVIVAWDYEPTPRGANRNYRSAHRFTITPGPSTRCSTVLLSWIVEWKGTMSATWPGGASSTRTPRRNSTITNFLAARPCP